MSAIANKPMESYLINAAPTQDLDNWRGKFVWNFFTGMGLLLIGWMNIALLTRYPALVGWIPAGVSLGLILIKGPRLLPGVFFGVLMIGLIGMSSTPSAILLATESALLSLVAWYVLNRKTLFDLAQRRISDVGLLLLISTILSTGVALVSGPHDFSLAAVAANGQSMPAHETTAMADMPGHHAGPTALTWVFADAIGILLAVPLALRRYRWSLTDEAWLSGKNLGATLILLFLIGLTISIYGGFLEQWFGIRHTTLLILPPAVWLALKYDLGFTLAGNIAIFFISGIGTSLGQGPFGDHTQGLPLLTLITLFTTLLVAASRTERKVAEATIQRIATQDHLTGLPNRSALNQRLTQLLYNADRYQRSVAVIFIDLDQFKQVNDTLGHEVGDRLLIEAAQRLSGSLRGDSVLARFGGDEFIALLDHVDDPAALHLVGKRMLDALSTPIVIDGHECCISCSGGIAVYPGDGNNAVDLIKNADIAMYHIKAKGRNGFQLFSQIESSQ